MAPYYDRLMRQIPYGSWVDYVEKLLQRHGIRAHDVLDLACGTGSVGCELLRRGYRAWGVDLSEPMVRGCASQQPPLPAAVMDAARLGLRPRSLDLVVSLYDSLNYIVEVEGLQRCFDRVHDALRPGGGLIFDLNTPLALESGLFTQNNLDTGEPLQYDWRAFWNPATQVCRVEMWFRWLGKGGPVEFTETHFERAYAPEQVIEMLRQAGFTTTAAYDAYSFRPPYDLSDRAFFVAL